MKTFLIFLLAFVSLQHHDAFSKTLIISDVDDTIKMTDVLGSKKKIFFNGVFREKAFAGMGELYQQFDRPDTVIHYVSGSPKIIRMRVVDFLEENEFPQQENLSLKNKLSDDTVSYKINTIIKIIDRVSPEKIILIGDDTEHDPEIYSTIAQLYPSLVDSIYIRSVKGKELPELKILKTFFSAVEIAAYEMQKERMDVDSLKYVANAFIHRWGRSGIFIKGRYCPKDGRDEITALADQLADEKAAAILNKTQRKIIKSCS